jgi:hypothetical protein
VAPLAWPGEVFEEAAPPNVELTGLAVLLTGLAPPPPPRFVLPCVPPPPPTADGIRLTRPEPDIDVVPPMLPLAPSVP